MVVWPSGLRRPIQVSKVSFPIAVNSSGTLGYRKMQEFESLSNHLTIFYNFCFFFKCLRMHNVLEMPVFLIDDFGVCFVFQENLI